MEAIDSSWEEVPSRKKQALREMVRRNPSLKGIELKHVNDGVR